MPTWLHITWAVCGILAVVGMATWTILVAWPFMRDTRHAAVKGLQLSIHTSKALEAIVAEVRALAGEMRACTVDVDRERVDKLLKAVENIPAKIEALKSVVAGAGAKSALKQL